MSQRAAPHGLGAALEVSGTLRKIMVASLWIMDSFNSLRNISL